MINLTKSFYIKMVQLLVARLEFFKNDETEWDRCMRDINFVSSMYRFPRPTVAQMDTILNICDKLGIYVTDTKGQRIRDIYDYECILDEMERTNDTI